MYRDHGTLNGPNSSNQQTQTMKTGLMRVSLKNSNENDLFLGHCQSCR